MNLKQLQKEISSSLNRMPEKYKEVYLLHDESQFTIKKISKILNRPVDTVEKQFRKATELLRNHLRESKMMVGNSDKR
jgi:RNA polymerase sigma-70 factor (ECF subfamily)